MTPEMRVGLSLARDGITLPEARERLPMVKYGARKASVSMAEAKRHKAAVRKKIKQEKLSVERKISASLYKKMKLLQLRGWTMSEIAKFLKCKRESVVYELYVNTILER